MSKKIVTVVVSDLSGDEGASTNSFSLDGKNYEIDLTDVEHSELVKTLEPFVSKARRVSGGLGRTRSRTTSASTRS